MIGSGAASQKMLVTWFGIPFLVIWFAGAFVNDRPSGREVAPRVAAREVVFPLIPGASRSPLVVSDAGVVALEFG